MGNSPARTSTSSSRHFVNFVGFGGDFVMSGPTRPASIPPLRSFDSRRTVSQNFELAVVQSERARAKQEGAGDKTLLHRDGCGVPVSGQLRVRRGGSPLIR